MGDNAHTYEIHRTWTSSDGGSKSWDLTCESCQVCRNQKEAIMCFNMLILYNIYIYMLAYVLGMDRNVVNPGS